MMKKTFLIVVSLLLLFSGGSAVFATEPVMETYEAYPPFLSAHAPPLVMLVMGRNHKLYYEAYNDASDLDNDGDLDVGYNPDIDYYGYFDCFKCYTYNSSAKRFEPSSSPAPPVENKKCLGVGNGLWSGDFLNYLTMTRMDALRKVLYGGYRSTDTETETVLERVWIPQDAHSWGKEYESIERDGYDIRDYTPLNLPSGGTRHLFASTTLGTDQPPILRVLPNNPHRIWEWVAKERPVCDDTLETSGSTSHPGHPTNHTEFETIVNTFANVDQLQGSGTPANGQINGSGNPYGADDNYLTVFTGQIIVSTGGTYSFAVDGDDAVEVLIDGNVIAGYYGGHGACSCTSHNGSVNLSSGYHTVEFRHEEGTGGDKYYLYWKGPDSANNWNLVPAAAFSGLTQSTYGFSLAASTITDYVVRVKVGVSSMPESNCKRYPNGTYKPVGILQRHGESEKMFFGLLTGSYKNNTAGGVLRKRIGPITDEINENTGQFDTSVRGIVNSISSLKITGYSYSGYSYNVNCGWIATRPINDGECAMWGNPIAEMMYETLRYYAGTRTPTNEFVQNVASSSYDDYKLGLRVASWNDPYDPDDSGYHYCSKPFMLVLSDTNPTHDSDDLPGSAFGSVSTSLTSNDGESLNVDYLADLIGQQEGISGQYFIGQVDGDSDNACTEKTLDGLGGVRGLCPEEPSKRGSYYSASVSYFGNRYDMNDAAGKQRVKTYVVALASPLPRIEFMIRGRQISLVPFAKSVGGYSISTSKTAFQPTNTIVDFFVDTIEPTYGRFRINYEDVEQGADHDMDAIIVYEYQLIDQNGDDVTADNIDTAAAVEVKLTSEYAAGSIIQHCGYIISGTTHDGTYLEVRDKDTGASSDPDYYLDTPPGVLPYNGTNNNWDDNTALPLENTRIFYPNTENVETATLLKDPLFYAAKWGGFTDKDGDEMPGRQDEWDQDGDNTPDNYFFVVNPLRLEEQLNATFAAILGDTGSGTAASVLATNSEGEGNMLQAYFRPTFSVGNKEIKWSGYLQSMWVDAYGNLREDTDGDHTLDVSSDRIIRYYVDEGSGNTLVKLYNKKRPGDVDVPDYPEEDYPHTVVGMNEIHPIWEAGENLAQRDPATRKIFTFVDSIDKYNRSTVNGNGTYEQCGAGHVGGKVMDSTGDSPFDNSGEVVSFTVDNLDAIQPFLGLRDDTTWGWLGDTQENRSKNLINYIRGYDSDDLIGDLELRNRSLGPYVWKLGDIVTSTPVAVSKPSDSYHLIYGDQSYQEFLNANENRETVVYVGSNDGMMHAFTSWVYNVDTRGMTQPGGTTEDLGDEIWAYVPQALLPHLKWYPKPNYSHVYYVDLKPKVFDAKINGQWRTILVIGLNLGGKHIQVKDDFDGDDVLDTRDFYSTYTCLDVTTPREPKLLWERSYTNLGLTTSVPNVVGITNDSGQMHWYLSFGSGYQTYDGESNQKGYLYVVDLETGEPYPSTALPNVQWLFESDEEKAFFNSPVAVDKTLDKFDTPVGGMIYQNSVDAVYFGESYYSDAESKWKGKVYKVKTTDSGSNYVEPTHWSLNKIFDAEGPIYAQITASTDLESPPNTWLYFGTGRFLSQQDKEDDETQYFFGIKDPTTDTELARTDLFRSDNIAITTDGLVLKDCKSCNTAGCSVCSKYGSTGSFDELLEDVRAEDGWYRTLSIPMERSVTKMSVIGGTAIALSYVPVDDVCSFGGETNFYALYYETGTAYTKIAFLDPDEDKDINNDGVVDYDDWNLIDLNGDGVISQADYDMFFTLDSNGDGVIDENDYNAIVTSDGAYVNMSVLSGIPDANGDGAIDVSDFIAIGDNSSGAISSEAFNMLDANNDGVIDASDFGFMDMNNDGRIDTGDFNAMSIDVNGDGVIDENDILFNAGDLSNLDWDNDGSLTSEDFQEMLDGLEGETLNEYLTGSEIVDDADGQEQELILDKLKDPLIGAPPPATGLHAGQQEGLMAFPQQSTGEIPQVHFDPAFKVKSGLTSWREKY